MSRVYRLINTVQDYSWGSYTAIPELLGQPSPADKPQAELWMGTHAKAPSRVVLDTGKQISLVELIARDPAGILGGSAAEEFSGRLPFLFKVLAAAQPLSIQAHPDRDQAIAGYRRENEQGIPLDAFQRNYRDDNHKPEVISALTPFWALNGFRPLPEMIDLLQSVQSSALRTLVSSLAASPARDGAPSQPGLKTFFAALMHLGHEVREQVVAEAVAWAKKDSLEPDKRQIAHWILRLYEMYPGDIGVLSPLLLNLVLLQPGDTMFLHAGVLHAYLEGMGIELMANSDNVIRGGLTPKHMDVEELLRVLRFRGAAVQLAEAVEKNSGQLEFQTPAREFKLAEVRVQPNKPFRSPGDHSIELMIVIQGEGEIESAASLPLSKGDSLVVPASAGVYTIRGSLRLYKAYVPSHLPP
jgi:mannose-6-phosphate isomerase